MSGVDPDDKKLSYIALDKVTATRGTVNAIHDNWWSVHPERGVLIWKGYAPQCNPDERISQMLTSNLYPWAEVRQIPLVLIPINPRD